jgi:ribosome-associated protein
MMKLPDSAIGKLGLDEDLHLDVVRARAITAPIARRRAERNLAGLLRRIDLVALATTIENVRTTGLADPRRLHITEGWRTRLLDEPEGIEAFRAAFPTANHKPLPRMIEDAKLERSSGKPPGAGRALFRHISAALEAAEDAAEATEDDADDVPDDDAT